MDEPADPADALGEVRDLVVGEHAVAELLDAAVVVEAAVVAADDRLALDEQAPVGRLLEHREERPHRQDAGARGRLLQARRACPRPAGGCSRRGSRAAAGTRRPASRRRAAAGAGRDARPACTPTASRNSRSAQLAPGTTGVIESMCGSSAATAQSSTHEQVLAVEREEVEDAEVRRQRPRCRSRP